MNIPVSSLCAAAGIGRRTYDYIRDGRSTPTPSTLGKLQLALHRHKTGYAAEATELAPHAAFKMAMVLAAFEMKANAHNALTSDHSRRATMDRDWLEASRVRRVAIYVINQFFGFSQTDTARAAGMTKQAVHLALKTLEDERDRDPALASVLDKFEELLS